MYVYGVLRATGRLRLPSEGVAGRSVERVEEGSLAALVSEVGDEPVRPSRRNVMAHSAVLQEVVLQKAVLPVRFGVVMPSADAVREELLVAHGEVLRAELEALGDCVELDVTVTCRQDEQLREAVVNDPRLLELVRRLDAAGYQERIAFGERVAQAVDEERDRVTGGVVAALDDVMVDAIVDEPRHEDVLASVACLVSRDRVTRFERALEAVSTELGEDRSVRCVGPLPPYHFVDLGLAREEAGTWA